MIRSLTSNHKMYRFKYRRYEDTLNQNLMLMQLETGKKQNKNASFYFLYKNVLTNYPIIHNHVHTQYSVTPFASSTGKRRHALILRCFLVLSFEMCFANFATVPLTAKWCTTGVQASNTVHCGVLVCPFSGYFPLRVVLLRVVLLVYSRT